MLVLGKQSGNVFGHSMAASILAVIRVIAFHAFGFINLALLMSARRQVKHDLNSRVPLQQTAQFQIANRHRSIGLFVSFKGVFNAPSELLVEKIVAAVVLNYEL